MDYTVAAVDEAINLLLLVAETPGLGVSDLSRGTSITKARAFRLLATLEQRGLVRRQGDAATYSLGYAALRIGAAAAEQIDLLGVVREPLDALGAQINETVMVRVRDGHESLCIARVESTHSMRVHGSVGHRRPLYAGASGKLLLAFAAPDILQSILTTLRTQFTERTPVEEVQLMAELSSIRQQRYATSFGERTRDVVAGAVPIRDGRGEVIAALSLSAPASRESDALLERHIVLLQATAAEVEEALGFRTTGSLAASKESKGSRNPIA